MTTKKMGRGISFALALAALSGCPAGSGSSKVDGNVGGAPLAVHDALAVTVHASATSAGTTSIILTDASNVCEEFAAGKAPAGVAALALEVLHLDAQGRPSEATAAGKFDIVKPDAAPTANSNVAVATFATSNDQCATVKSLKAVGGSITIDHVDATGYTGSFDITFDSGEHISGRFDAIECAAGLTGNRTCTK
jgi:hypothetical protein